jgi:hypothetical protein
MNKNAAIASMKTEEKANENRKKVKCKKNFTR